MGASELDVDRGSPLFEGHPNTKRGRADGPVQAQNHRNLRVLSNCTLKYFEPFRGGKVKGKYDKRERAEKELRTD